MKTWINKFLPLHLSTQFTFVTVVLAVVMSLLASYVVKTVETKRLSENLREQSLQTLKLISQSSAPAFEINDLGSLNLLTSHILEGTKDICRVRMVLNNGEVLIDRIKSKPEIGAKILTFSQPVIGNTAVIGSISIFLDLNQRLKEINKNAYFVVIYSLSGFLAAIMIFLLIANKLVLRPIKNIENHLKEVSNGSAYEKLEPSMFHSVELKHLSAAVDDLHQRILMQSDKEHKLIQATFEIENVKLQLVQAIEAITEGFVYYDTEDRLTICNEKYREIYSESSDLLVEGNTFENIIRTGAERGQYEDAKGRVEEWIKERMQRHRNPKGPIEQRLNNGRWVRIIETRSADGGLVGIRSDITAFKKQQKELKEAMELATQANETKSQFLAMMSHEIRTPLNGVLGILGFLGSTKMDEEQKKLVATGQESASILLTVINDILDFSKLEVGKVELEMAVFDPSVAFDSIVDLLEPGAFAKGITLQLEKSISENLYLLGDSSRLRQILLNLIGNAIKFTKSGGVRVLISSRKESDQTDLIKFEVIDTGIGIAAEKQDLLFGQFVTVESSYTREYGGTGLGLSISKSFVDLMGGKIGFDSEEGNGSRFWFEVLLLRATDEEIASDLEKTEPIDIVIRENLRVLVVEDNAANQMVIRKMLHNIGCEVDLAGNGIEAVDAVKHFPYDIIFMDISMPEMDGLAATRKIRKLSGDEAKIPIIAMTAHALKEEKEEFLASGMDDYLQKPAPAKDIQRMVAKWIGQEKKCTSDEITVDENVLEDLGVETNPDMLSELIVCFIEDTRTRQLDIQQTLPNKNSDLLLFQAHSLGSSAATFGAISLHHLCRNIEMSLKDNNLANAYKLAGSLNDTIEISLHKLSKFVDDKASLDEEKEH